ncbi:hypothetical protein RRG08_042494 [Elysia crispata]|uniref:Uncharacterized protein n=1 Tax=Elysia crispata TaxID=231223 RepID=A0AAE1CWK5_9GAST|nr:hypothetical protein RRG08_042494 [Elysia crispata]
MVGMLSPGSIPLHRAPKLATCEGKIFKGRRNLPLAKIRDGPSRPAKLSDRKKHDWMKSSIAEYVDGSLTTHAFLRRICNALLPRTNLH